MISHIVNPKNSAFRFTIVYARQKNLITRRDKSYWTVVTEHMNSAAAISPTDSFTPFHKWVNKKDVILTLQFEEKNQNKIWYILQYLIGMAQQRNFLDRAQVMHFVAIAKGVEISPAAVTSDEKLLDWISNYVPVLKPGEMISWELTIQNNSKLAET